MINIATILLSAPLMSGAAENVNVHELIMGVREDSATRMSLRGDDSPVTVDVSGFLQFRYLYNDAGSNEATRGFDIDRARIKFSGEAYEFGYAISGQWSDTEFELKDAFLTKNIGGFDVKAGQFVTSFYNGYVSDPTTLVTGDYSITALTYGQGYSQGIEVSREYDSFSFYASYNDGFNTDNSSFGDNDYGVSGRVEFTGIDNVTLGGAFANEQTATESYDTYTFDASFDFDEFVFDAAYVASNRVEDSWNNYSIVGTASYVMSSDFQIFGQYEYGVMEGAMSDLNIGTIGANIIFNPNVRWTNSFGYAFNAVDGGYNLSDTGWESSSTDGQYVIKSMLTISF
tara:strand:+ start:1433 stop:2461 length:1029 start_codon:yes stop_codon:yes gene_type:complete